MWWGQGWGGGRGAGRRQGGRGRGEGAAVHPPHLSWYSTSPFCIHLSSTEKFPGQETNEILMPTGLSILRYSIPFHSYLTKAKLQILRELAFQRDKDTWRHELGWTLAKPRESLAAKVNQAFAFLEPGWSRRGWGDYGVLEWSVQGPRGRSEGGGNLPHPLSAPEPEHRWVMRPRSLCSSWEQSGIRSLSPPTAFPYVGLTHREGGVPSFCSNPCPGWRWLIEDSGISNLVELVMMSIWGTEVICFDASHPDITSNDGPREGPAETPWLIMMAGDPHNCMSHLLSLASFSLKH